MGTRSYRRVAVEKRKEPKSWSIGLFVAACLWILGDTLWGLGTNILWLLGVCAISFIVDTAVTGSSSKESVYID